MSPRSAEKERAVADIPRLIAEASRSAEPPSSSVTASGAGSVAVGGSANGATIETHIYGNTYFGPPPPDVTVLLNQGIQQLRATAYQAAITTLKEVVRLDPSMRSASFYLAIALLRGRRPKVLTRTDIQGIDELLCAATATASKRGVFVWFRALIRDDYFSSNGLLCPPPSVQELISTAMASQTDLDELRVMLDILPMQQNKLYQPLVRHAK